MVEECLENALLTCKSVVFQLDQFREFDVRAMFLPQVLSNFWSLCSCVAPGLRLDFSFVEGLLRG